MTSLKPWLAPALSTLVLTGIVIAFALPAHAQQHHMPTRGVAPAAITINLK